MRRWRSTTRCADPVRCMRLTALSAEFRPRSTSWCSFTRQGSLAALTARYLGMILRQAQDDRVWSQDAKAAAAVLSEINVTPFTDVLLVLLIIFMILASLAIPPGFERSFPCNCNRPVPKRPLYPLLANEHSRAPRDTVSLDADAKAPYGFVIRVLHA